MNKEININLDTIIDLLSKLLKDKKLYLKVKKEDLQLLKNKYVFIDDLVKEINKENYIICYNYDDIPSYNKILKQIYILLIDIKYKYNKIKDILNITRHIEIDNISIIEINNILFNLNLGNEYSKTILEKLKTNRYNISDYLWITNFINKIKNTKIINYYLKYQKFNNNNIFKNLNTNISQDEIKKVQHKLECLLNNKYALIPPIYMNEFTDYFINLNLPLNISESELFNYISDLKLNTNAIIKPKWYQYLNKKRYNEIKIYNKTILEENESIKKDILNQYKENLDYLKIYISSFYFLKEVINENYFKEIYSYLYDENAMYTFIKNIYNTLTLYKEFLSIKEHLDSISFQEFELLSFCYDKNDTIKKYKEKLFILPSTLLLISLQNSKELLSIPNLKRDVLDTLIVQLNNNISILSNLIYSNKFNILSSIRVIQDMSVINKALQDSVYIFSETEHDQRLSYIEAYFKNKNLNFEISPYNQTSILNYQLIKFIKETTTNLGYKVVQDYKFESINLELVVFNPKNPKLIVYFFIDCMHSQSNLYFIINKLSYIREKNIPIIYCWSDYFIENRNKEILKLKTTLKGLL